LEEAKATYQGNQAAALLNRGSIIHRPKKKVGRKKATSSQNPRGSPRGAKRLRELEKEEREVMKRCRLEEGE